MKISSETYEQARRVYWYYSTTAISDHDWQKSGGGADLCMDAMDIAKKYRQGKSITTPNECATLRRILDAQIPDEFDLADVEEAIRRTQDYVYSLQGTVFPM